MSFATSNTKRFAMVNAKQTSKAVALKLLPDGRYNKTSKSVAGSALAQAKRGKSKPF
jgi:hypothetical protein